jgi:NADH:ubiquinone oxidoreductase subunit 2 (subunit N)
LAVVMFMQEPDAKDDMPLDGSIGLRVTLALCAGVVLAVGIAPGFFLSLAEKAAHFAG